MNRQERIMEREDAAFMEHMNGVSMEERNKRRKT